MSPGYCCWHKSTWLGIRYAHVHITKPDYRLSRGYYQLSMNDSAREEESRLTVLYSPTGFMPRRRTEARSLLRSAYGPFLLLDALISGQDSWRLNCKSSLNLPTVGREKFDFLLDKASEGQQCGRISGDTCQGSSFFHPQALSL